jgi:hypothetical protein
MAARVRRKRLYPLPSSVATSPSSTLGSSATKARTLGESPSWVWKKVRRIPHVQGRKARPRRKRNRRFRRWGRTSSRKRGSQRRESGLRSPPYRVYPWS